MTPTLNLGILGSSVVTSATFRVFGWGQNLVGEVGDGTTTQRLSPVQVGSNTNWTDIAAGWDFIFDGTTTLYGNSHGLRDKELYSWGRNSYGELGDGTTTDRTGGPVKIGSDTDWDVLSAAHRGARAIKTNGKLYGWGNNAFGQLGDGTTTNRTSPTQTGSDTDWAAVSAGGALYTLAIKTNGKLYGWGRNNNAEIGDGTTTQRTSPVQIGSATDWAMVSTTIANGFGHSHAITTGGKLYSWGNRNTGQLGDGNNSFITNTTSPTRVGSDTDWATVAAGAGFAIALKTNGKLYGWGSNSVGQLGDGTTTNRLTPVQIGSDTDWLAIGATHFGGFGIKTNGKLYGWGQNSFGELGDGTTTQRTSPVQIGSATDWTAALGGRNHSLGLR